MIDTERYLYSDCALLALAVNSLTGWPVVQIIEAPDDDPIIRHVLVRMPDGRLLDAEGPHENYWGEVTFDRAAWGSPTSGRPRMSWPQPGNCSLC